jgi:hypothetical protein
VRATNNQSRRVRAHDRHLQALELRKAGATYQMIADQLGYAQAKGAYKAVTSALKATLKEPAEELRTLEAERLDAALLAIWRRVTKGDDKAIDRLLGIMKKRMELFGFGAAKRQELSGLIATLSARDLNLKRLTSEELAELERLVEKLDVATP